MKKTFAAVVFAAGIHALAQDGSSLSIFPGPPATPNSPKIKVSSRPVPRPPTFAPPLDSAPKDYTVIPFDLDTIYKNQTSPIRVSAGGAVLLATSGTASLVTDSAYRLDRNPSDPKGFRWVAGTVIPLFDSSNIVGNPFTTVSYGNTVDEPSPWTYPWTSTVLRDIDDRGNVIGMVETPALGRVPAYWPATAAFPRLMGNIPGATRTFKIQSTDTLYGSAGTEVNCITANSLVFGSFYRGEISVKGKVKSPFRSGGSYWGSVVASPTISQGSPTAVAVSPSGAFVVYRYPNLTYGINDSEPRNDAIFAISDSGRFLASNRPGSWSDGPVFNSFSPTSGLKALAINSSNDVLAQRGSLYRIMHASGVIYAEEPVTVRNNQWEIQMLAPGLSDGGLLAGKFRKLKDDEGNSLPPSEQVQRFGVLVKMGISVDADRDGEIKSEEASTASGIFNFWINDDNDGGSIATCDIPGSSTPDGQKTKVQGVRDLIDYFPVFLDIKQLLTILPPGTNNITYKLKQADSGVRFVYTDLKREDAFKYLNDNTTGDSLKEADAHWATSTGYELDATWLGQVKTATKV